MKTQKPMGRPKKQPSAKQLAEFTPERLLFKDVKTILIKYQVPKHWNYMDVLLLIQWLEWPKAFNVIKTELVKPFEVKYTLPVISFGKNANVTRDHDRVARALHLAKLFAEAPDELIEALPKIRKQVLKYYTTPMKSMMMNQAMINSWIKSSAGQQMAKKFWNEPANKLVAKDTTTKTVEKARAKIRSLLAPEIPPKGIKKSG